MDKTGTREREMIAIYCGVCKLNKAIHYADAGYFCCGCFAKHYKSIKYELQKQKELNAELVKTVEDAMKYHWLSYTDEEMIRALIIKSKEL